MAQQVAQLAPRAQPEEFACTSPVELQLQQLIPYILCRPIDPKIVKRIRQSLGELGFLYDAGKLSCVLLTGNPGDANATYGLVNGHHRHSALTQEKAAGNPKHPRLLRLSFLSSRQSFAFPPPQFNNTGTRCNIVVYLVNTPRNLLLRVAERKSFFTFARVCKVGVFWVFFGGFGFLEPTKTCPPEKSFIYFF
jgi:hypothetical protein